MRMYKLLASAASLVLLFAFGVQARAASLVSGVVYGCVSKQSGVLRVVPPPGTCNSAEYPLLLNVQGPPGPRGPAGMPGAVPPNLADLSTALSTTGGVGAYGAEAFVNSACSNMNLGDIVLSVNGYGQYALPADGRILPINQNQALFSLLGTTFGGNGTTNFALPDLRPFAP